MRILYVVPYVPGLVRVRPYNLIRFLAAAGHQVTLLCLYENEDEAQEAQALAAAGLQVTALPLTRPRRLLNLLLALPGRAPLQAAYCWQPAGARALETLLREAAGDAPFDVVHVEHLRGARYALQAREARRCLGRPLPIVWDSVDNISHLFRQAAHNSRSTFGRWITRLELRRTEQYEAHLYNQFDRVLVTSPADAAALEGLVSPQDCVPGRVAVLPNGVDLDYFTPPEDDTRHEETLVVSGKMSYHANVTMVLHLVQDIMPLVWAARPLAQLQIVGHNPAPAIQALSQHPRVTVTGTVPDMRPYLQQATLAVAPLTYGAGIQNKVLEAMACATPVVTTPAVLAALQAEPGRDLLAAERPTTFASLILALLADPGRRQALGHAGRAYVEQHHDWRAIAGRLAGIYQETQEAYRAG